VKKNKAKSNSSNNHLITQNQSSCFTEDQKMRSVPPNSIKYAITSKAHLLLFALNSEKPSADSLQSNGIKQMVSMQLMLLVVRLYFLWIWCRKWICLKNKKPFTVVQTLVQYLVMAIFYFLINVTKTVILIPIFLIPIILLKFHIKTVKSHTMLSVEQQTEVISKLLSTKCFEWFE